MKQNYFNYLVVIILISSLSIMAHAQKNLLMIGVTINMDDHAADRDMYDSLTAWGYEVTFTDDDVYNSSSGLDVYSGIDGVFINEPLNSRTVTKFGADNYPLPCIVLEGSAVLISDNRWGWVDEVIHSGSGNASELDLSIIIKDNDHYITNQYTVGQEIKWADFTGTFTDYNLTASLEEQNVTYSGKLAVNKALKDITTAWNMITIDSSATFPNNMFFWSISSASLAGADGNEHNGTMEYYNIIKRACEWAFDLMPVSAKPNHAPVVELVVFPNPASGRVTIRFKAPVASRAKMSLFDITGQQIQVIMDKKVVAGNNFISLNTNSFPSGVYFIKLKIEDKTAFSKIVIQ